MADVIRAPQQTAAPQKSVEESMDRLLAVASAGAVFGQPVTQGDTTIIPCSEVAAAIGLGGGSGYGPEGQSQGQAGGNGAGGGGGARSRPVAAIVITPQGVRVEPVLDVTRIVLASMVTGGFALAWLIRLVRASNSRSDKAPSITALRKLVS
jgi:uncharacterized spore protein YtfJ